MEKGLCLGLLLSFIGVGNVIQAYKVTIENKTVREVKFRVIYHGVACRRDRDERTISAGESTSFNVEQLACRVEKVEADVYHHKGRLPIKIEDTVSGDMLGGLIFNIEAQFDSQGLFTGYKIIREAKRLLW